MWHNQVSLWQALAESAQVIAVAVVGFLAWKIGQRQNFISQRLLTQEEYVTVQVEAVANAQGVQQRDKLTIQNLGKRPIVLVSYALNGGEIQVSTQVAGGRWFNFPVPGGYQHLDTTISILVTYKDIHGTQFTSQNYASLTTDGWVVRSLENTEVVTKSQSKGKKR